MGFYGGRRKSTTVVDSSPLRITREQGGGIFFPDAQALTDILPYIPSDPSFRALLMGDKCQKDTFRETNIGCLRGNQEAKLDPILFFF